MAKVHATLRFPATGQATHVARVQVRIEDVSRADAAAVVVGSTELTDLDIPAEGASIDVDVEHPDPAPAATLTVRAHASVAGDVERLAAGDFLSTQAVAPSPAVEVPLQRI